MNRRKALLLTLLSGGLLPARLLAQDRGPDDLPEDRPARRTPAKTASRSPKKVPANDDLDAVDGDPPPGGSVPAVDDEPLANLPAEAGHSWRTFDISRYTALEHTVSNAQNGIVEWIFRTTGTAIWHGEKIAVLSAGKTQIRAYHNARILKQVANYVRRFTESTADVLSIRVRFVTTTDTRWRYLVHSRLQPIGGGPHGQQIWTLKAEDAAQVLAQLQIYQGFRVWADRKMKLINGQTLKVVTTDVIDYTPGSQRDSNDRLGVQPAAGQLDEGVSLRLSPLLTLDGDTLDAAIDLKATTVKPFHKTKILTRREIGNGEISIDVPEVSETHLNQTIQSWPLGQTLLISAGVHPGIFQSKGGFLNLRIPGTVPTSTELLVFLDAEVVDSPRTARRRDD